MQKEINLLSWDLFSFVVRRAAYMLYALSAALLILIVILSAKGMLPHSFSLVFTNYAVAMIMLFAGYRLAIFHRDFFDL